MNDTHDRDRSRDQARDRSIDALLRRTPSPTDPAEPTEACLDAEQAAAWFDGGLTAVARERAEAHVADCARCQALVGALVRTESVAATRPAQPSRGWLGWFVPLAGAAAVVVAVLVIPWDGDRTAPEQLADLAVGDQQGPSLGERPASAAVPPAATPVDRLDVARTAERPVGQVAGRGGARSADEVAGRLEQRQSALAAARPAEEAFADAGEFEVLSTDPTRRWRVRASAVDRTTDGGITWLPSPTGLDAVLTAGSAPTEATCWLVGRAGVVLLTTDGLTWQRVPFPVEADLVGVEATGARTASVTTADGRVFRTTDAGATWAGGSLQEN